MMQELLLNTRKLYKNKKKVRHLIFQIPVQIEDLTFLMKMLFPKRPKLKSKCLSMSVYARFIAKQTDEQH